MEKHHDKGRYLVASAILDSNISSPDLRAAALECVLSYIKNDGVGNCPFCGMIGRLEMRSFGDDVVEHWRVICEGEMGHALDHWEGTKCAAIEIWNSRKPATK